MVQSSSFVSSSKLTITVRKVWFLTATGADDFSGKAAGGAASNRPSRPSVELAEVLNRIDGSQYPAYHDIEGAWYFGSDFQLQIDRAQVQSSPQKPERTAWHRAWGTWCRAL